MISFRVLCGFWFVLGFRQTPTAPELVSLGGGDDMRERVAGILVCDHRVALIRRNRGGEEYYLFPGGGVDPGETRSVGMALS